MEGRGRWGRERGAEGEGLRAAGEVYMGWRGARGEGRGVGYGRLGAKAGRGCLAGTGARDEWAASGSRCGARGSRRRAMRGVGSDGLGAKGGVACLGSAPIYPTIQARGFTPGRVGKTTGANPGGYQAIAMGGISQGDHRRLCHRPVPPCGAAFGGDSQRHLGAYGVDLPRHGPRVPVDSALHGPRLPPAPGQKVRGARVSAAHYLAPAAAGHCLHQPLQPLAGAKPHG